MIRITQQNSAGDAKRYYATADYYSQGQEIVGRWGGKGADLLGLDGTVDKFSFDRLCDNLHPQTGEPLTVRTRTERRVGYDFTFSVPKSVSLLYAMSGDGGRSLSFCSTARSVVIAYPPCPGRIQKQFPNKDDCPILPRLECAGPSWPRRLLS